MPAPMKWKLLNSDSEDDEKSTPKPAITASS